MGEPIFVSMHLLSLRQCPEFFKKQLTLIGDNHTL